jgi:hypothetical protein
VIRPADPRVDFPARVTPSVRRVMYLDYDWVDLTDVRVHGAVRDEVTDLDGGVTIASSAVLDIVTSGGLVSELVSEPDELDMGRLVGQPLRMGFRARVRDQYDGGGAPLGLLLDDVPGALIAAGYVHAIEGSYGAARAAGPNPSKGASRIERDETPKGFHQADLCSGWRSDSTMMVAIRAGEPLPFRPTAPVGERPGGANWPARPIPLPGLRRYRRMDVVADALDGEDVWRVDAWFRDTHRARSGACGALHEYTVHLVARASDHEVLEVRAIPHALPWDECPAAGDMVDKLSGTRLDDLRGAVPKVLRGIESCTHLTNELRELADVPYLASLLPAPANR